MNEKASRKNDGESTDSSAEKSPELPGIDAGEEIALEPVEGEEIDPLPKWWDEPITADRGRPENRRLEEGVEPEQPRRKPLRSLDEGVEVPSESEAEAAPPAPDPVAALAQDEAEAPKGAAESPESTDNTFFNMPEIDAGAIRVKRTRKGEEAADDGDLSVFFGEDSVSVAADPSSEEPDKPTTTAARAAEGLAEGTNEQPTAQGAADQSGPLPKGPPPIPLAFDGGFEEKTPLIASAGLPVKMRPPASADAVSEAVPASAPATPATPATVPKELAQEPSPEPVATPEVAATPPEAAKSNPPSEPSQPESAAAEETKERPQFPESEESFAVIGDPLSLEEPKKLAAQSPNPAPTKKKAGCWTIFATLFFFATLFALALLAAGAFYAWSAVGRLTETLAETTREKLARQDIHLDYGGWSYEFPRGFVFDEVTLYEDASKSQPVLKATGLGVNVDIPGLIKDAGSLNAAEFSLRDSKLTFYQKGALYAEIGGAEGEILADASAVSIERLAATVGGLRVRLDGVIKLPDKDAIRSAAPGSAVAGETPSNPLGAIDLSAFRDLAPWLSFENTGGEPPLLSLSFSMDAREPDLARIEGHLGGSVVKWRGIDFKSLSATFRVDPKSGELRFPNLQAEYGEGLIGAVLSIDMGSQTLKIERLQSTVDVPALLTAYDAAWSKTFQSLRFVDAPTLQISGEMPLAEPGNAKLAIRYEHLQGLVYRDGERELPLTDLRGKFTYDKGALETNDAAARLFGGVVSVNGATNLAQEKRPFTGLIELTGVSLKEATSWFGQDGTGLSGRLALTFRGTGTADISSVNGGGNLRIEEAELPTFPAVGKVQALLGGIVPAFGIQGGGTVMGAYILESGVLVTSDLTVRNGGVRIVTNGNVNLSRRETSFVSSAEVEPSLAAVTGLKDKVIQVEGKGPLTEPALKLRQFPVEFAAASLAPALGTTPETLGMLKSLIGSDRASEIFVGTPGATPGLTFDPAVETLIRGLLGEPMQPGTSAKPAKPTQSAQPAIPAAPAQPAKPTLRAIPQN